MKIKENDKERILKLRKSGLSYRDIGRRFNCSASTILRRFQKWNVKDKQEALQKQIRKKVKMLMEYEARQEAFRKALRALFNIPLPEKKKPIQVKQPEDDSSWAFGSIEADLNRILKQQGEDYLL